ncbi:S41 family peptidase [Dysgonomonas sp. 216]|uniref:S41 family peptidase n=1 Tax=Dysgonomonas sp. 216 TaxID=2302934 RepID=UPI0013D0C391|nr:S41 family peptidase [Dysgonomonas sp. 216]NDW17561.1 S41 family peptidase [Dysgonomonas sp. 216]
MNKLNTNLNRLLIVVFFFSVFTLNCRAQFSMGEAERKIATAFMLIDKMYVDKIDADKLSDDAITALLSELDPHSSYIKASELKEMNEPLEGNFDGIGVTFNMATDTLFIIETIAGGPSEKIGILPGDKIILVNDTLIAGVKMPTRDVMKRLRGPKGTAVNVKIQRRGIKDLLNFRIVRDKIPIHSLNASYMIDNQTGYISLVRFGATTYQEFKEALARLQNQGMKNLILDLQSNGGGYLSAAIDLTNEFLGKDKLIVYTEGANQPRFSEKSKSNGMFENGKVVILVNETSASASEILSGAIQDWDRGVIVGRRTFGKGLVQRQLPLPGGSAMRLTVARYYTPTGRSIQKPYTNGDKDSYDKDLIARYNHGEMMSADSIHFPDSLKYRTLINDRIVYGGGGIMPDYFVPLDTLTDFHREVWGKGLFNEISMANIEGKRNEMKKQYPTVESFKNNFVVGDDIMSRLLEMAKRENIEFKEGQYNVSKKLMALQIKALMAQFLFNSEAYTRIINDESPIYQKGVEIINDDQQYKTLLSGKK